MHLVYSSFISSLYRIFVRYVFVQSFLTLLSLPLLVNAGFSISPLSFVGNIVFAPFIVVHLGLSFVVFLSVFLSFPSAYLVNALSAITALWCQCTQLFVLVDPYVFACPPPLFFGFVFLASFAVVGSSYSIGTQTACLFSLLIFSCAILTVYKPLTSDMSILHCKKKSVIVMFLRGQVIAVAPWNIPLSPDALEKWTTYTLKPFLAQKYGKRCCDSFVIPLYFSNTDILKQTSLIREVAKKTFVNCSRIYDDYRQVE